MPYDVLFYLLNKQNANYVWNKKELLSLNPNSVDYLLGELFFLNSWLFIDFMTFLFHLFYSC
jgi:hypothetical protein